MYYSRAGDWGRGSHEGITLKFNIRFNYLFQLRFFALRYLMKKKKKGTHFRFLSTGEAVKRCQEGLIINLKLERSLRQTIALW